MNAFNNFQQYPSYPFNGRGNASSNIILVTSLEEALYRTTSIPSDMLYVHQTQPLFYRVKVDNEGRKTWSEYPYSVPNQDANTPVNKAEFNSLLKRFEELEQRCAKEVTNEQSVQ